MADESTTPDLEEKVRQALEAVNRRDFDVALAIWTPDAVFELSRSGWALFETGHLIGPEAIQKYWEALTAPYEDFETTAEEFRDLGGVTFTVIVQRGRPHGSNGFVERRFAVVLTWTQGRVARTTNYSDVDEARAAAERLAHERAQADV